MIGIFDSGVGGLTVVRELRRLLPEAPLLYFGDTARTPYGNKGPDTIRRFAIEDAQLLVDRGATVLVVACNTMSAVALDALRERFPGLPLFDVITPAVAAARNAKRVAVVGTRATMGTHVYRERLQAQTAGVKMVEQACPLLVPLVEEGMLAAPETTKIVRRYLAPLKRHNPDALILGCTHYPFLKKIIQQKMGKTCRVIDSAEVAAIEVAGYIRAHPDTVRDGEGVTLLFSDLAPHTEELARTWAGKGVTLQSVSFEAD